jgi:hypothetical protein
MRDLQNSQCKVTLTDTVTGKSQDISLDQITKRIGTSFIGRKYLSGRHHTGEQTMKTVIQVFDSEKGTIALTGEVEILDERNSEKTKLTRRNSFSLLISRNSSGMQTDYSEQLTYKLLDLKSFQPIYVQGKSREDAWYRRTGGNIQFENGKLIVSRTNPIGLQFSLNCQL